MDIEGTGQPSEELPAEGALIESESPADVQEETTAEPAEAQKPRGVQKRLDELTALRRDAERDRDYWRQLALANAQQQAPQAQPAPQSAVQQSAVGEPPRIEQFEVYDDYLEARARWAAADEFRRQREQDEERRAHDAARAEAEQRATQWSERAASASTRYADFATVALDPNLPISEAMADVIQSVENGPDVLYHLGKHPGEAVRIARLSPAHAAFELGALAAAIKAQPKQQLRPGPTPIQPLGGGAAAPTTDPSRMSADEWRAWRNEQLRQ